jgi:hypothetical protein
VSIADLFKFPTVRSLAQHLSGSSPGKEEESSLNRQRAGERRAALSARATTRGYREEILPRITRMDTDK